MSTKIEDVHTPVLENEILHYLQPLSGKIYVDATLGLGGHAARILEAAAPHGRLLGFEWDREAAQLASARLAPYGERFRLINASYATLCHSLAEAHVFQIDGLLLDLGVSSLQLDRRERGFSFRADGPLDMRMNEELPRTAADLVRQLSETELADIFYNYGEERQSRRIAAHLVKLRDVAPIITTRQLAEGVAAAVPKKYHPKKIHVATKVFQALRIAVNGELDNLVKILRDAPAVLRQGAAFCVITFHSLEDRITKQLFAANPAYQVVTSKPVEPTADEIRTNPRARSAKLRVALRT